MQYNAIVILLQILENQFIVAHSRYKYAVKCFQDIAPHPCIFKMFTTLLLPAHYF